MSAVPPTGSGRLFGEGCLAAQPRRIATASAMNAATVLIVEKPQMLEMLHTQTALAEQRYGFGRGGGSLSRMGSFAARVVLTRTIERFS
jgi:hypothetical protein